jgi:hypothetical protein
MKSLKRLIFFACLFFVATSFAANPMADMTKAASAFVASLKPEQLAKATFEFKTDERENWNFVPKARNGLPIKEMSPDQRALAHALMKSALSKTGYEKSMNIMSLELVLHDIETKGPKRDPELYYFSIFGKPGAKDGWGWRVEGHHISINITVAGKEISVTPSFLGSNPAEVRQGPRQGLRVLANEEDLGRQLLKSFSPEQKTSAIFATNSPREVITGNSRKVTALKIVGLPQSKMTKTQSALLMKLIEEYVTRYRPEIAKTDLAKIRKAGLDKIYFGWAGGEEPGQPHYYRIQGPTFLMEFDNTQNNANHIHAVWRDFEHDFGEDVLREHYEKTPHAK